MFGFLRVRFARRRENATLTATREMRGESSVYLFIYTLLTDTRYILTYAPLFSSAHIPHFLHTAQSSTVHAARAGRGVGGARYTRTSCGARNIDIDGDGT